MKKKTGLILLVVFLTVLALVAMLISFGLEPFVKHRIEQRVMENNKGLNVNIRNVDINVVTARATISDVNIELDTLHNGEHIEGDLLKGSIRSIHITGIKFWKIIFQDLFKVDDILISDLDLVRQRIKPVKGPSGNPFGGIVLPESIEANRITLTNTSLKAEDKTGKRTFRTTSSQIPTLTIEDWKHKEHDTLTSVVYRNLHYNISYWKGLTQDSLYTLELQNIEGDTSRISMDSVMLIPQFSNYVFAARKGFEMSRIDLGLSKVSIDRWQLNDFLDQRDICAGLVTIGNMQIDVFRDKRIADNVKIKPMMQELLHMYEPLLKIDTLQIKTGDITYTEHALKASVPGKVYFTQITSQWRNITNDTSATAMQIDITSLLMNKSRFDVSFTFPIKSKQNRFTVSGNLASMDLASLNSVFERNVYVFASGQVQSLEFHFTADDYFANGDLTVLYNDLHLKVKDPETNKTTALKERFTSFMANLVVINDNDAKSKNVRKGVIDHQRDPQKFIIHYSFKAILAGLRSTILKPGNKESSSERKKRKALK